RTTTSILYVCFSLPCSAYHRDLHSFPTRRSSDLGWTTRRWWRRRGCSRRSAAAAARTTSSASPSRRGRATRWAISLGRKWPTLRSEEHTSELQSRENLVCRLLLEKKKKKTAEHIT